MYSYDITMYLGGQIEPLKIAEVSQFRRDFPDLAPIVLLPIVGTLNPNQQRSKETKVVMPDLGLPGRRGNLWHL